MYDRYNVDCNCRTFFHAHVGTADRMELCYIFLNADMLRDCIRVSLVVRRLFAAGST